MISQSKILLRNYMKRMIKKIRQYIPFTRAGMQGMLIYKAQVFMWLFISFTELFFVVYLYKSIYRNSENGMSSVINGFTFYEMILYMVTSFVFTYIGTSSDTSWNICTDIQEGTIAVTLTKPVSYRLRHLFTFFGSIIIGYIIIVIPILTIVYGVFIYLGVLKITITRMILNIILFFIFSLIAALINDALRYFIGLLTFFTEHLFGLNLFFSAIQSLLSGMLIPLSYMGVFGVFCAYTPFAFMNSTPVLILMNKVELTSSIIYLGIGMVWIILLEFINHLFFKFCIKKVSVQGG